jgi:hypothetical protein
MKPWIILLIFVFVLSGCLAGNLSLPRDEAGPARFQHLLVVAMEPPPLKVPLRFESGYLAYLPKYPIQAARVGGILTTLALLLEAPAATRRSAAASKRLEELLSQEGPWEPTMILAREAASQLAAADRRRVTVSPQIQPIPGLTDRYKRTQSWMVPIRTWYNQAEAVGSFKVEAPEKLDAVVEIAILNYELNPDKQLSLQVLMKVLDPATGQVIGRGQASDNFYFSFGPLDQAFAQGGRQFKEIFGQRGKELMAKCLMEIGLL